MIFHTLRSIRFLRVFLLGLVFFGFLPLSPEFSVIPAKMCILPLENISDL